MKHTNREGERSLASNMAYCASRALACRPQLLFWCALAVLTGVLTPLFQMLLPREAVARLAGKAPLRDLLLIIAALSGGIALSAGAGKLAEKMIFQYKIQVGNETMRLVARKALETDYANSESEVFQRLREDSFRAVWGHDADLRNVYGAWVSLLSGAFGFAVYTAILVELSPLVALFMVLGTLASLPAYRPAQKWADAHRDERASCQKKMSYVTRACEDPARAKDIRLYGMRPWLQGKYAENMEKLRLWQAAYGARARGASLLNAGISFLCEGAAYAYLVFLACAGQLDASRFLWYFFAVAGYASVLGGTLRQFTEIRRISRSVNRVRAYLDYPNAFRREGGAKPEGGAKEILILNVGYRYEGAQTDAVDIDRLVVAPGEHIGVVGLNGAGKTTLVKLICGLLDPARGNIYYGGIPVPEYDREAYYGAFSAVFQRFSILPLSVREIVAAGLDGEIDDARVEACLRAAGLFEKIQSLEGGIQAQADPSIHENGAAFSGGETQKLLLARALYKDAPILVLDEPTAALDPLSENRLYETYHEIARGKTSLFISHRLASTRFCDRILLIEGGKIVEQGTHAELLKKHGAYAKLFETQAKYYREAPDPGEANA